ncbi:ClpXP protease specificity-enhancing factor SspB [Candidatus Tisiphia endosymbiont of Beris chalybata]|uniref:ClpXP protease specificity-enhancing factor SspB n=1 Tax=Candidatus Tisiphia endosymbiont of Beris chalybata TaxID=3066262 RepID=UPI00312C7CA5
MSISYWKFLNECMLEFAKKVLSRICSNKLQQNQVLYISYRTDHPAVVLSSKVKKCYPKEITIVIQYQFEDLTVMSSGISLTVSFDNIKENIYIPFDAITNFADPNSGYNLKFVPEIIKSTALNYTGKKTNIVTASSHENNFSTTDNIIILDKFRKPTKPV